MRAKLDLLDLDKLSQAFSKRKALIGKLNNFRVFDGTSDGCSDLYIDKYEDLLLIHYLGKSSKDLLKKLEKLAAELVKVFSVETIYYISHPLDAKEQVAPVLLSGSEKDNYQVSELGIKLILKPLQNRNAGLFLDTRAQKKFLLNNSKNKKVLNTFCYTGALGLAALVGGASEVVQVDISSSILNWAKENYELNSDYPGEMRFIKEHALDFMQREVRRLKAGKILPYQIVILDPPAFGNSKGAKFVLTKDLDDLLIAAYNLIAKKDSNILISCNHAEISLTKLKKIILDNAKVSGVSIRKLEELLPPKEDFKSAGSDYRAMKGWVVYI